MDVLARRGRAWAMVGTLTLLRFACAAAAAPRQGSTAPPQPIEDFFDITLGGVSQKVLVQGNDLSRPILLWLHGGPGASAMLLAHAYTRRLRDRFIVVNWDQRGTAFSYHDGMSPDLISEENIVRDTIELTEELRRRYSKPKVFLLGHSFGTVVGLRAVQHRPDLFYAYVGMGQVIDFERSKAIASKWLERKLLEAHADEDLALFRADGVSADLLRKYGAYYHKPVDWKAIMEASPHFVDTFPERYMRGREFSGKHMKSDGSLPSVRAYLNRLEVPAFFFVGRHDHVMACAPELVVEYLKRLRAPKKKLVWFEGSAHHPNLEEPERFQDALIKEVLPVGSLK
jgi:proline iminopeptidase